MNTLLTSVRLLAVMTLLTGAAYPALVTALARLAFPHQAAGSLVTRDGRIVGSELLAQRLRDPRFFWPRPSAGDNGTHDATVPAAASNLGPTSGRLLELIHARAAALREAHPAAVNPIPPELLLASGSGLDPHLSPEAVRWQLPRVARARGFTPAQYHALEQTIETAIEPPQFGVLGEPRINVLLLNLKLPLP